MTNLIILKKNNLFYTIFIILGLYIFINNPVLSVLGGMGLIKLLYPFALFYMSRNNKLLEVFRNYRNELIVFIFIILFSLIRAAFGGDVSFFRMFVVSLIENIFIANFLVYLILNKSSLNLISILLITGLLGAIISTISFFFPAVDIFFKNIQVSNSLLLYDGKRNFGFADGLTYSYGITQGLIISFYIINIKKNYFYLALLIPLFLISILLNARTGVLSIFVALLYLIIVRKNFKILICLIFFIVFISSINFSNLLIGKEETLNWIIDFFKQLNDLFTGENTADYDTVSTLSNEISILPKDDLEWIFGTGKSYFLTWGSSSDVGFLLQLKYGGVIFMFMLCWLTIIMIKRINSLKNKNWYIIMLMSSIIIFNIKGDFIPTSSGFRLLFLIYIYTILSEKFKSNSKLKNIMVTS